jgi:hypothetical protein
MMQNTFRIIGNNSVGTGRKKPYYSTKPGYISEYIESWTTSLLSESPGGLCRARDGNKK